MNLKRITSGLAAALLLSTATFAADAQPKYLELENIVPAKDGEYVDIDLDEGLLSLASHFTGTAEKEASDVLRGLKHVRVHVIGLDDTNRASVSERIHAVREGLAKDGWKRLVTVRDGKSADDVMIFAQLEGSDVIKGLAVTVIDGNKQAVVVNVVGEIKPEQISALGARFDIDPLKKLALAKN